MINQWQYKINLKDKNVLGMLEEDKNILVPQELKKFIRENNAASPQKYKFDINGKTEVFGAVLNFNCDDNEGTSATFAIESVINNKLFPFAVDPFGNFICVDLDSGEIVFYEHETAKHKYVCKNLEALLLMLH